MPMSREEAGFDEAVAASYVGKTIIVGIMYTDEAGTVKRQQHIHGVIESISFDKGVRIKLRGRYAGQYWDMPPMLSAICPAKPGVYTEEETGDVIDNPELMATLKIIEPHRRPSDAPPSGPGATPAE